MPRRIIGTPGHGVWIEVESSREMLALFDGNSQPLSDAVAGGALEPMRREFESALLQSPLWPIRTGLSLRSFGVTLAADGGDSYVFEIRNPAQDSRGKPYPRFVEHRTGAAEKTIRAALADVTAAGYRGGSAALSGSSGAAAFQLGQSIGGAVGGALAGLVEFGEEIERRRQQRP